MGRKKIITETTIGIYTIINKVNNKSYVGSSIHCERRLRDHYNDLKGDRHENDHLQRAVNFYGIENFSFEILEICEEIYLPSFENFWGQMLNVWDRKYGYNNDTINPDNLHHRRLHKDSRDKISKSRKKGYAEGTIINPMLGKNHSEDSKKKIGNRDYSKQTGINNVMFGKTHSLETRLKISESSKNRIYIKKKTPKGIVQLDLNGNFIRFWNTIKEAAEYINFNKTSISHYLSGKRKCGGGFKWMYKEDYEKTLYKE